MYDAVSTVINAHIDGESLASYNLGDLAVNYNAMPMTELLALRKELARELTVRNIRKRTFPDFT